MSGDTGIEGLVRRGFYVGLAVLIAALAVAGFWPTYWGPLFSGTLDLHWLLHLHGIVFTSWLVLLIVQTTLVYRGRTDLHQRVGKYVGVGWGALVFTIGLSVAFGIISPAVGHEFKELQGFIGSFGTTLPSIFTFVLLFGAALAYRKRPAIHKRLMIVATLALLDAATARLGRNVLELGYPMSAVVGHSIPIVLIGLAIGHDRWTRQRVHPAYWIGAGVLILVEAREILINTDAWADFTAQIAAALKACCCP